MSQLVAECVSHIQAHQQLLCLKHEHHLQSQRTQETSVYHTYKHTNSYYAHLS